MRRRIVLLVAAACLVAGVLPATASGFDATWRIVGSRTANVQLRLTSSLDLRDVWGVRVHTSGRYGGFMLRDKHGVVVLAYLYVRSWQLPHGMAMPIAYTHSGVERGDYLMTLFADGNTTVTVPVGGIPNQTFRPRAKQRIFTGTAPTDVMPASPVGSPFAAGSLRMPTANYALAVVAQTFSGGRSHVGNGDACFASTPGCADADAHCFSEYFSPTGAERGFIIGTETPLVHAAPIYAESNHQDTSLGSSHAMFVLAIPVQQTPPKNSWSGTCGFSFSY